MTLYDEREAEKAIIALPKEVKLHIQHLKGNGLQNILCALEMDDVELAKRELMTFNDSMRRVGL